MCYPRVLVVSNVPFSTTNNTGQTLSGLFKHWDSSCLAQLYFRPEMPEGDICSNYYRFSDVDALKSLLMRWHSGTVIKRSTEGDLSRADFSTLAQSVYSFAYEMRTPQITLARDLMWYFSAWMSKKLENWIHEFSPEVIFFPFGDGVFTCRIVEWISRKFGIPTVTVVYDDFLLGYDDGKSFWYRLKTKKLNKWAHRVIDGSPYLLTTCRMMSDRYTDMFNTCCTELYSAGRGQVNCSAGKSICYFGNVGLGRWKQLIQIGRALKKLGHQGLDVYTREQLPEIMPHMTAENGIRFHGALSYDEVRVKTAEALAVVHVESFDENYRERVRFSLSTKIADMLTSGVCPLVYGPLDVASVRYFKERKAGCVVTCEDELEEKLRRLLSDNEYRSECIRKAMALGMENHDPETCRSRFMWILKKAAWGDAHE